jgi:hypothetical protein
MIPCCCLYEYFCQAPLVTPKELVDKHPEIEKRLTEAEKDVTAGRVSGPFKTAKELAQHLHTVRT